MNKIMKKWTNFLENEEKKEQIVLKTRSELYDYLKKHPKSNKNIEIDRPKGSKKWSDGKNKKVLTFDYGEWTNLINPADKMGWDLIIMPKYDKNTSNLEPIGHLTYKDEVDKEKKNDKIILAPNSNYTDEEKQEMDDFFSDVDVFKPIVWYKN
jgi:hypothetical protein